MKGFQMQTIKPKTLGKPIGEAEIFKAFDNLIASKYASLAEVFKTGRLLLIVNDSDRRTPTAKIIKHIDAYLKARTQDFKSKYIDAIIATGSHEPTSEEGLKQIFDEYYELFKPRIKNHKAKEDEFEFMGNSEKGTPIKINKLILGYDKIIAINSIEPHYFAGYTGGRKSLVPGLCHYDTIEANHKMAMDENSKILSLDGNPVHEDMIDITHKIVGKLKSQNSDVVAINCVESGGEIYSISTGDILKGWEILLPKANELFTIPIRGKFDIVIAQTSHPLNKKLYQALKSFENGRIALREGGIIILEAICDDGIGPENFYNLLTSAPTPAEIVENVRRRYTLGAHKTTNLLAFLDKNKLYIVSELPDEIVKNCFCRPFKTVDEALGHAIEELGIDNPRILKIVEANNVVPLVS